MYQFINLTEKDITMENPTTGERTTFKATGTVAELDFDLVKESWDSDFILRRKAYGHVDGLPENEMEGVYYIVSQEVWENYWGSRDDILYVDPDSALATEDGIVYRGFICG